MLVSYEWLKEYVPVSLPPQELAERLTAIGVTIDTIINRASEISNCVVGYVVAAERHPNADRLTVCRIVVREGSEPITIVTGATNVTAGARVPVALSGATLPGGVRIETTDFRGVPSAGMLLSAEELGMIGVYPDGILILPDDAPVGEDAAAYLGLRDPVFEIDLTPNYAHCLSLVGVAHEVAALTGSRVNWPAVAAGAVSDRGDGTGRSLPPQTAIDAREAGRMTRVDITARDLCRRYSARIITDLRVGPSPLWLQRRLEAAGVRPISNVVDVTNYVMLELGQPLHAFDYDKLHEHRIVVRRAKCGEQLVTLDGAVRQLDGEMLVIADADRPVGLAGVMGGLETEVTDGTRTILLESASFAGANIRRTSVRLGLRSEASLRFEKGFDPNGTVLAADRAAYLLELIGAGRALPGVVDVYPEPVAAMTIPLRLSRVHAIVGLPLGRRQVADILRRLDFSVADGTEPLKPFHGGAGAPTKPELPLLVTVPTRRTDIEGEIDLTEEIARHHGYHNIETRTIVGGLTAGGYPATQVLAGTARDYLVAAGLTEVINYAFTDPAFADRLALASDDPRRQAATISNPLTSDRSVMRTTLLDGTLRTISYNHARRNMDAAIFELRPVYRPTRLPLTDLPREPLTLSLVLTGKPWPESWNEHHDEVDFFALKGIVEGLLNELGVRGHEFRPSAEPTFHPGRQAALVVAGECLGHIGEVHPTVQSAYDLKARALAAEIDFDALLRHVGPRIRYQVMTRTPAVARDLALITDAAIPEAEVEAVIRAAAGELLDQVTLFDVYQGENIPAGKRSLAFTIVYRAADRALTDAEVEAVHDRVRRELAAKLGADLRS
ncbi:MAG: phenylalanine--tRNA ligase subunit beta [Chloroflexota bacterium]